jgi:hypothetical protein
MSTVNDPRPLTRKELRSFLPSDRAVRAFERIFDLIPPEFNDINNYLDEIKIQPVNVSADYEILNGNYLILVDASAGPVTVTLPDVETAFSIYNESYFTFGIAKIDNSDNVVTVACQPGQTVFDESTFDLLAQYEVINVIAEPSSTNYELAA